MKWPGPSRQPRYPRFCLVFVLPRVLRFAGFHVDLILEDYNSAIFIMAELR